MKTKKESGEVVGGYVPSSDARFIKEIAKKTRRSKSYYVAIAVREWVARARRAS